MERIRKQGGSNCLYSAAPMTILDKITDRKHYKCWFISVNNRVLGAVTWHRGQKFQAFRYENDLNPKVFDSLEAAVIYLKLKGGNIDARIIND